MHIDLVHAAISAVLILLTIAGMRHFGIVDREHKKWDWKLFAGVFVVMLVFNLIWPAF
ncbi:MULTISPECIES: hypothetical protein [unclassified Meridianimarinicoccus]|uniref:hypothetical protein n=1 Tax=unclassified Meridianimarinicoccus TaxID=2923344 RepID=UPI0018686566|nr:hypothetical protein [Fluviibacterium sp. MJW13]